MEKIVLANWKAHLSPGRASGWTGTFAAGYRPVAGLGIVLAVPDLCMARVREETADLEGVSLAGQAVSPYPPGSYTGATPAAWLQGLAAYVLVGHNERRRYFHEGVGEVAAQVREAVAAGLRPVVCLEHAGAAAQVAALDNGDMEQAFFAYTPADAVQLEQARDLAEIGERIAFLRELTGNRPVLYGGGVNENNAAAIMALPEIGGLMVGRSCLDPAEFLRIIAGLA